jgi:cytidylate kinase
VGIITIARQAESRGELVAAQIARDLGLAFVDRAFLERVAQDHGLTTEELDESDEERRETSAPSGQVHVDYLQALLLDQAEKEDLVLLGRGGQFLFAECPWSVHVKIVASLEARVAALQNGQKLSRPEAEKCLADVDRQRNEWVRQAYGADWEDPVHYDLVVRTDRLDIADAAAVIRTAAEIRGVFGHLAEIADWIEGRASASPAESAGRPSGFVHPSEAEVARVLDFYRIRWQYEPTSFPLAWNAAGQITEAFRPDFYLPDLDLYLELTTLKQSLVTDKNRKIRKFRERYPNVQLKVFYGRDFRSLVQKYGLSPAGDRLKPAPIIERHGS